MQPKGELELSELLTIAMLCNAMRHLRVEPPQQMRDAVVALQARQVSSATGAVERRALAKIADARRVWAV